MEKLNEINNFDVFKVGNAFTDIYIRKSQQPEDAINLIVIPGNPGIIGFYKSFIDILYMKLDSKFNIYGISHAGHGAVGKNGKKIFTLQEQIEHKINFLESDCFNKDSKFILMGHSVGAWIALKVLKRRSNLNILQVVNLFPTVRHLWDGLTTPKKILILPVIKETISSIVHYTPKVLQKKLLTFSAELAEETRYVTEKNLDYYIVMNVLSMARNESFEIIEMDEDIHFVITNYKDKLIFLYGPKDKYANEGFYNDLKDKFPGVAAHLADEEIAHAFVMSHSEHVANKVYLWIQPNYVIKQSF